jgi:hypothetical protein
LNLKRECTTKQIALTICFGALYSVLSLVPITPIIGISGKAIALASVAAPVFGIILGPYLGAMATGLGGVMGSFTNLSFSPMSVVSGIVAACTAGLLIKGRRAECAFTYFSVLFVFAFYPLIGPIWLYPPLLWLQIVGFLLLVSPIMPSALKQINSESSPKLLPALFTVTIASALAGQIAGSLTYEALSWPVFLQDQSIWQGTWQAVAIVYPIERTIIALIAALIGVPLLRVLKSSTLISIVNEAAHPEKRS